MGETLASQRSTRVDTAERVIETCLLPELGKETPGHAVDP
jgi:hypothetical protein